MNYEQLFAQKYTSFVAFVREHLPRCPAFTENVDDALTELHWLFTLAPQLSVELDVPPESVPDISAVLDALKSVLPNANDSFTLQSRLAFIW